MGDTKNFDTWCVFKNTMIIIVYNMFVELFNVLETYYAFETISTISITSTDVGRKQIVDLLSMSKTWHHRGAQKSALNIKPPLLNMPISMHALNLLNVNFIQ